MLWAVPIVSGACSPLCKHPLSAPSWLYSDPEQEVISYPTSALVFLSQVVNVPGSRPPRPREWGDGERAGPHAKRGLVWEKKTSVSSLYCYYSSFLSILYLYVENMYDCDTDLCYSAVYCFQHLLSFKAIIDIFAIIVSYDNRHLQLPSALQSFFSEFQLIVWRTGLQI